LARELRLWSQADLAGVLQLSPAAVSQFENGTSRASEESLRRLSLALNVPPGYLTLRFSDTHEGFFRSLRKSSVAHRRRARAIAHVAHDVATISGHLAPARLDSIPVLDVDTSREEVAAVATSIRKRWQLPAGPIDNVVTLLEERGVLVMRSTLQSADVDAFSLPFPDHPVVVLGADKQDRARSRFDAAHELGHLVMHGEQIWGLKQIEDQAHWFSAEFLMPRADIYDDLPTTIDWPQLFSLKQRWQVSLAALLMRSRTLGRLSPEQYLTAIKAASARGWRRSEPVPLGEPEQPQLIGQLLDRNRQQLSALLPPAALEALSR
jgi:Zn-dependent peptidase ImmA (M78 family)